MGCSSWLVESQRFPASLHGIYNRRCYLLAPRCFRINRRSAASNGKTNSACPARRAHSYGRSLRRLPLCGKQSTVSHRRDSGRGRRSDRCIRRLRNPAPFGRRVACQRHFCRFARRLGRDRTRLFLRFTLTPAASRATECDRGAVSQRFSVGESGRSNGSLQNLDLTPSSFPRCGNTWARTPKNCAQVRESLEAPRWFLLAFLPESSGRRFEERCP